jgi:hypothetical protein
MHRFLAIAVAQVGAKEDAVKSKIVIVTGLGVLLIGVIIARTPRSASGPGVAFGASPAMAADSGGVKESAKLVAAYGKPPLAFEANHGQIDSRVKFLSRGPGYTLFLTPTEAVLTLKDHSVAKPRSPTLEGTTQDTGAANVTELRINLLGARPTSHVEALVLLPSKSNYFIGNDPAKWRTNVPMYAKVSFKDVYTGVDLVYYGNQGQLEYDFVVAPGADLTRIQLSIDGAEKLDADADGNLVLQVAGSEVHLRKPTVYQEVVGGRKEIASRYVLRGRRVIGFEVAAYDANRSLVIDPVLSYSSYLGGSNGGFGNAIAVDSAGNAYVTGETQSTDFPTMNPAQSVPGGNTDVFVSKFDSTGSTLIYSTYLGGTGDEVGSSIAVDASGNAYVTGFTQSQNFPTKNPIQANPGGGSDAFVGKLDSTGSVLVYSTYLGGNGNDFGNGIAADLSGNAYVAGKTGSINFPTKNPLQPASGGGDDAFVAKLDPAGSALVYSTYLGGSFMDEARGIAVDSVGNAYVTGDTASANFPTKNPFQIAPGGTTDAFLVKLNSTGSALVYSTYLGGGGFDQGNGVAVDASGNAYVSGQTSSTNFPTKNPFQGFLKGSIYNGNAFVTKFDPTGSALVFSTYLGGSGNQNGGEIGEGIAVDSKGNTYVTGLTSSSDFPLSNPIQSSFVSQSCDYYGYGPYTCGNTAFVTEFNAVGAGLIFSTYVGAVNGNFEDGRGIALDVAGNVYVAGSTPSTNLLVTPGAFQLAGNTNGDAFIAKISPANAAGFSLSRFSLTFPDEGVGGTSQPLGVTVANTGSATLSITSIAASGDSAVAANNSCGSSLAGGTSCTINVTFNPTAAGARNGTITFIDSAASSPQTVKLSGKGISGLSATLTPSTLNFNSQTVGTTSAVQMVSLANTGTATLTINGVSISGANSSSFTISASTNGSCGGSLVVDASCTVGVAFAPLAVGNLGAMLVISDNSAQSPRTVVLTGVGLASPTVTLSPTNLSFPAQLVGSASPAKTVTLSTSGSGRLAISSISPSNNFSAGNNCAGMVAGGGSCSITVTFTPTTLGNLSGSLVIVDNASDSPQMVSLAGLGTDFSVSSAAGSPSSATVTAGQSATYTVTVVGTAGFSGTALLTCASPATDSNCVVAPNSLPVNGTTPANATVTVTTKARSSSAVAWRTPSSGPGLRFVFPWLLLVLGFVTLAALQRLSSPPRRVWLELAIALLTVALFFGCGGGSSGLQNTFPPQQGTPAGAYQISVNATTAGVTRTTTLTLNVQ